MENLKGILIWVVFLTIFAAIYLFSRRIKKQTEENGIETTGVISRIVDEGGPDEIEMRYYVTYPLEDGTEMEGLISNPSSSLQVGQRVRLKYHPKLKANARIIY